MGCFESVPLLAWLPAGLFMFMAISTWRLARHERKIVDDGCCGRPWTVFDRDSQGGYLMKCDACDKCASVSWVDPETSKLKRRKLL